MDIEIKNNFMEKWEKYFPGSELPIACFYSDELKAAYLFPHGRHWLKLLQYLE